MHQCIPWGNPAEIQWCALRLSGAGASRWDSCTARPGHSCGSAFLASWLLLKHVYIDQEWLYNNISWPKVDFYHESWMIDHKLTLWYKFCIDMFLFIWTMIIYQYDSNFVIDILVFFDLTNAYMTFDHISQRSVLCYFVGANISPHPTPLRR